MQQQDGTLTGIAWRSELREDDFAAVVRLHAELYRREFGYAEAFEAYVAQGLQTFRSHYDRRRSRAWLCEQAGRLAGCLFLEDRGTSAQLRYFLVRPEYRGRGLGTRLMSAFMDCLRERGYTAAYLWTTNEQSVAARLYLAHGFKRVESRPSSVFGKRVLEERYAWTADHV